MTLQRNYLKNAHIRRRSFQMYVLRDNALHNRELKMTFSCTGKSTESIYLCYFSDTSPRNTCNLQLKYTYFSLMMCNGPYWDNWINFCYIVKL